jgi:glycosyltransferase involved in cell wall biosynthesis
VKVLAISTDYPPHGHGGYEQQCRDVTEHLRSAGHRVRVVSGEVGDGPCAPSADVHRELPRFPVEPRPVGARAARRAERRAAATLRRHLAEFRPDVVCVWRLGELSMSLPARAAAAGAPVVGVVCDPWMVDGPRRDPWARRRGRQAPTGSASWLFVSAALRRQVGESGLPMGDSEIVPAGVDLAGFPLAPAEPWRGRLLYAGRLSPLKGVDIAIRALSRLPESATLAVAGSGPPAYERRLHAAVEALRLGDRVRFLGALTRAQLAGAYAEADALLFPVRWAEPFGLVPLEAMARGTPVIAVAAGGASAYLRDGDTALVAPPEDATALAAAVDRLAGSPALRERLRAGGRAMAERYPAARSHRAIQAALERAAGL